MQLHEEVLAKSATGFGWSGAGFLAIIQVLFFVALGYTLTRARAAYCSCKLKVSAKKVDDENEPNGQVGAGCKNAPESPARSTVKARQANAQERKRLRKASQSESKKDSAKIERLPPSPIVVKAINRACEAMTMKAEQKPRKSQLQNEADSQVAAQAPPPPLHLQKYDDETLSQDGESTLSPTASTPSVLSDSDASPASMDLSDCIMQDSPRSKASWDDSGSPTALKEGLHNEVNQILSAPGSFLPSAESRIEIEQQKELGPLLPKDFPKPHSHGTSDEVSDGTGLDQEEPFETSNYDHSDKPETNGTQEACPKSIVDSFTSACVNPDSLESDTDSDASHNATTQNHASTSDSAIHMANAPVLWCSAPEGHIEGWVAVALPVESAPPGALDGLWMNSAEEKILVEKLEIMFESGVTWDMDMHSLTSISVLVDGQTICAELDGAGEKLLWSDGDVWTFFGRTEDSSQAMVELESANMPFLSENVPVYQELPMPPQSQWMPRDVKRWNLCWDWERKGRCPRGANCEWHHPEPHFF